MKLAARTLAEAALYYTLACHLCLMWLHDSGWNPNESEWVIL